MSTSIGERLNKTASFKLREKKTFYEKLFYSALKGCKNGSMKVYYPESGEYAILGNGNEVNGSIEVVNPKFFRYTILYGEIGFAEAYIHGYYKTNDLFSTLAWFLDNQDKAPTFSSQATRATLVNVLSIFNKIEHWLRPNSKAIARKNIAAHYDLSNEFFELMLDETMTYSSGVFLKGEDSLKDSQENKYRLLAEKINLNANDHLLEIGSGWGGNAIFCAKNYGCKVTTVTISQQQFNYAKKRIEEEGLTDKIDLQLKDYRDIEGQYDKIVSIEMVEALGYKYFDTYFKKVASLLKPGGMMSFQAITFPDPHFKRYLKNVDFTQKHIFPGSLLLSLKEVLASLDRTSDLMVYDVESIGLHYAKTLKLWQDNVEKNWSEMSKLGFDDEFYRKWIYYLVYCEVGFQRRYINDVQIVLSRPANGNLTNFHSLESKFDFAL